jgi:hypothetical protein
MPRATLTDHANLKENAYAVVRDAAGWRLTHDDGEGNGPAGLMIGGYGQVAPTEWEAVAEGLKRIEDDQRHINVDYPADVTFASLGVTVTICPSAGLDGAPVVMVDTDESLEGADGSPGPRIRIRLNDEPVFVGVPHEAAEDVAAKERATCSACGARTYRGEECVCEDGGDAEDYEEVPQ